jgi:hypothetical protein
VAYLAVSGRPTECRLLARSVSAGGLTKFPVLEVLRMLGDAWPDRRPWPNRALGCIRWFANFHKFWLPSEREVATDRATKA